MHGDQYILEVCRWRTSLKGKDDQEGKGWFGAVTLRVLPFFSSDDSILNFYPSSLPCFPSHLNSCPQSFLLFYLYPIRKNAQKETLRWNQLSSDPCSCWQEIKGRHEPQENRNQQKICRTYKWNGGSHPRDNKKSTWSSDPGSFYLKTSIRSVTLDTSESLRE